MTRSFGHQDELCGPSSTLYQSFTEPTACFGLLSQLIMIKASGIDLSDPNSIGGPSGLSGPQLIFFCARFGTKNAKEIASFRKCSLELADLLTVGNQVCRDGGRAGSAAGPEECKNPKEPSNKNCKRQKRGQVRGVCGAQLLRDCVDLKQGNCDDDKISLETCQHINVLKTGGPGSNKCYGRVEAVCAKQNLAGIYAPTYPFNIHQSLTYYARAHSLPTRGCRLVSCLGVQVVRRLQQPSACSIKKRSQAARIEANLQHITRLHCAWLGKYCIRTSILYLGERDQCRRCARWLHEVDKRVPNRLQGDDQRRNGTIYRRVLVEEFWNCHHWRQYWC